jgi:hypothetical protein
MLLTLVDSIIMFEEPAASIFKTERFLESSKDLSNILVRLRRKREAVTFIWAVSPII